MRRGRFDLLEHRTTCFVEGLLGVLVTETCQVWWPICKGCGGPRDRVSEVKPLLNSCAGRPPARFSPKIRASRSVETLQLTFIDRRALARRFLIRFQCMSSFRNFTSAAKKFAPKNPRERVDAMSNKPCPLHDQGRKRPCKQANNPLDICVHFQPNRSRCAPHAKRVSHLHAQLAARSRPRARSRSQIHGGAQCAARPARPACAVTPRWHGPPAGAGLCVRLSWGCQHFSWRSDGACGLPRVGVLCGAIQTCGRACV